MEADERDFLTCRTTAKKFLAAANFLELLSVFGEVDTEVRHRSSCDMSTILFHVLTSVFEQLDDRTH